MIEFKNKKQTKKDIMVEKKRMNIIREGKESLKNILRWFSREKFMSQVRKIGREKVLTLQKRKKKWGL